MASDKNLFDDMARVAGGAASLLSTVRRQIKADLKDRASAYTSDMDLADRAEVERLQATVSKLRLEQESMKQRIAALEAMLGPKKAASPVKSKPKAAPAKKAAAPSKKPKRK